MRAAVDGLVARTSVRRIAVLGDMAELGRFADDLHRELGNYIAGAGVERVFWLGEHGGVVKEGAIGKRNVEVSVFDDFEAMMKALEAELAAGDSVLVKASRASRLDRVVDRLRAELFGEGQA